METKYMVLFKGKNLICTIIYDFGGFLKSVDFTEGFDSRQIHYVLTMMAQPRIHEFEEHVQFKTKKWQVLEVKDDMSFEAFWDAYGYKKGNKSRAEKLWNAMSEQDRSLCFAVIPKYKYYIANNSHIQRLYPETFLSQKRYENEY